MRPGGYDRLIIHSYATPVSDSLRRPTAVILTAPVYTGAFAPQQAGQSQGAAAASQRGVVNRYCVTCHNQRLKTGGLSLDEHRHRQRWRHIRRSGKKSSRSCTATDAACRPAAARRGRLPEPRHVPRVLARPRGGREARSRRTEALHRLNRAEYRNAVRDLLALDIDVGAMLPADDVSYGFDNIAGVQRMSPTLMERYLGAAQKISSLAVGASAPAPTTETFLVPPELRQDDRLEGLPFGTRGGTVLRYTFPRDGVYNVRVQLTRNAGASFDEIPAVRRAAAARAERRWRRRSTCSSCSRGGEGRTRIRPRPNAARSMPTGRCGSRRRRARERCADVPEPHAGAARESPRAVREAGSRRTERLLPDSEGRLSPQRRDQRPLQRQRRGRHAEPPAHFRVPPVANAATKRPCAKKILSTLARRAFRRPVADADIQTLLSFYEEGRAEGGFELGIERAVEGLLVSPEFLFRVRARPARPAKPAGSAIGSAIWISLRVCRSSSGAAFPTRSCSTRRLREASQSGRARAAGPPDAGRSARRGARHQLRGTVAVPAESADRPADPEKDPDFDEDLRQGSAARPSSLPAAFSGKTAACSSC